MTKERIERAINVIKYAIENKISVKEASTKCGYADTYVKNIKSTLYDLYNNGLIEDEIFGEFDKFYKKYKKNHELQPQNNNNAIKAVKDHIQIKGDSKETTIDWKSNSSYPSNHIKTLDELLELSFVKVEREMHPRR